MLFNLLNDQHDTQIVRRNLAYAWSLFAMLFITLVVVKWGYKPEILTLLIGFVLGGSIVGGIMGTYFNVNPSAKPTVQQTADTITNAPAVAPEPDNTSA